MNPYKKIVKRFLAIAHHKDDQWASEMTRNTFIQDAKNLPDIPEIVCLCGSSRWPGIHAGLQFELAKNYAIVIPLSAYGHANLPPGSRLDTEDGHEGNDLKIRLDHLHFRKIDICDRVVVVRVDGYVGSSTAREVEYALSIGRPVSYHDVGGQEAAERNAAIGVGG